MKFYTNLEIVQMIEDDVFKQGDLLFVVPASKEVVQYALKVPYYYDEVVGFVIEGKGMPFAIERGIKYTLNEIHTDLRPHIDKRYKEKVEQLKEQKRSNTTVVRKYVKKPVVVEAIQYNCDNINDIIEFAGDSVLKGLGIPEFKTIYSIATLEGDMRISDGDYIIKGVNGEFYPCKENIFKKTYEDLE